MWSKERAHPLWRQWISAIGLTSVWLLVLGSPPVAAGQSDIGRSGDQRFTVLNPTGIAPPIERKAMAPRPASLEGKTVYLVDVTFNGGDLFLQQMQQWMAVNLPGVKTVFRVKRGVYAADDPALWKEIQGARGLMVMAIGH